jgi:hypothetical protein
VAKGRGETRIMKAPMSDLELKAGEERRRLQDSLEDLKERVQNTLNLENHVRQNILPISGIAGLTAAVLGYGIAAIFSRD